MRIKLLYLSVNGHFRTRWGKVDPNFPTVVRNSRDGMRHLITENAIWNETKPVKFNTFAELIEADAPIPDANDWSKQVMLCEDNFMFPITGIENPDWLERRQQRRIAAEHGKQRARHRAGNAGMRDSAMGFASIAIFGTVAVIALLLALVVIDLRWGG